VHTIHQLSFSKALELVLDHVNSNQPPQGECKVIAIDGPAGAGKTTMAAALSEKLDGAPIVHMDDLYRGWENSLTPALTALLKDQILTPISQGKSAGFAPWNWDSSRADEMVYIPRNRFLILEGVGSAQRIVRQFATTLIWIDIDPQIGLERVLERDQNRVSDMVEFSRQMEFWQGRQALHFSQENTFDGVHLRFDGDLFR
jgi:uridine kinase